MHYFSDQKDAMLAKRYKDMLDTEREAISSRMHALKVQELKAMDTTYRGHLQELHDTIKGLREQLRQAQYEATDATRDRDAHRPGGSHISRVVSAMLSLGVCMSLVWCLRCSRVVSACRRFGGGTFNGLLLHHV